MSQRIECPHCNAEIEITQVLSDQAAATIRGELQAKFAAKERELAAERKQIDQQQRQLDERVEQLDQQVQDTVRLTLEKEREGLAAKLRVEAKQAVAVDLQDRDTQLAELTRQVKNFREQELDLRRQQRELETKNEEIELRAARKVDQERKEIHEAARKKTQEENELKLAEKDHLIATLNKQLQ